jgi:hypothetical protein
MSSLPAGWLAAILALWLVVSVLGQFECRASRMLRRHDHFSLIPRWTFFAPRPGRTDYHLMVQLFSSGEEDQPWCEQPLASCRTMTGAVWNPEKRNRKALADLVRSMVRVSANMDRENRWQIQYSVPYIALLNYLSSLAAAQGSSHLRFMILESEGFYFEREPWPVFLSARHVVG